MPGPSYQQFQGYPNVVGNYSQGLDAGRDRAATQFSDRQTLETQNALVQQEQATGSPVQSYPQLQAMQMQAKQQYDMYLPILQSAVDNRNKPMQDAIVAKWRATGNPLLSQFADIAETAKKLDNGTVSMVVNIPDQAAADRFVEQNPNLKAGAQGFSLSPGLTQLTYNQTPGTEGAYVTSAVPFKHASAELDKVWTEITRGQVEEMKAAAEEDGDADAVRTYNSYIEGMNANKSDKLSVRKIGDKYVRAQKPAEEKEAKAPTSRTRDVGDKQITEEWKDGAWVKVGEAPRWNTRGNAREDRLAANQQFKNERDMRKDFEALPEVKNFTDVNIKASQMAQAIEESRKTKTFVAVDQALITMFNKMTDPNSVVRESEYARTGKDIALVNMIKGKAQKVLAGGAGLTTMERSALKVMSDRFLSASKERYDSVANEYRGLAKTYGYEPDNVVFRGRAKTPKSAADVLSAMMKANPGMTREQIKAQPAYKKRLAEFGLKDK